MLRRLILLISMLASTAYAEPIKYGQVGVPLVTDLPTYVAYDKGMFAKRGLEVQETIKFSSSAVSFVGLATGDIKFLSGGLFLALIVLHNAEPFLIGPAVADSASFLYVQPNITAVEQLKGRKVTVGGDNDITRMQAEVIFDAHGITRDIEWFWASDSVRRLAVMSTRELDAAILIPPFTYEAERRGFRQLAKVSDYKVLTHKALVFNKQWAVANPDKVQKIVDAVAEAVEWIYDERNGEESAQILARASSMSMEDARRSVDFAIKERLYPDSAMSRSTVDYFISVAKKWGSIKPGKTLSLEEMLVAGTKIKD